MIQKVEMYQAVCDGCGYKIPKPMNFKFKIKRIAFSQGWQEIGGRLYCPDCVEWDEETDSYKPKKRR